MPDYKKKLGIYLTIILMFFIACVLFIALGRGNLPLKGIENVAVSFEDFRIPEDASVVSIGEATHGNREFQKVKQEMLEKLVNTGRCKSISFEISVGEGAIINRAIHRETEDLTDLVGSLDYPLYDTKEIVELLSWMRDYNKGREYRDSVCFYGVDMQGSYKGLVYILKLSEDEDLLSEEEKETLQKLIDEPGRIPVEYKDFIKSLSERFKALGDEYGEAVLCLETVLVHMDAPLYDDDPTGYANYRDENMAGNVRTIYDIETKRGYSQILVTAHNGHVLKSDDIYGQVTMGSRIERLFPGKYYCIGTEFYYSTDNIHTAGTYDDEYERADHDFCSADPIAYRAKDFKDGRFAIDFASVKESDGRIYDLIHEDNFTGVMGEGYTVFVDIYKTYRSRMRVCDHYDAMIYYYSVNPIRVLHY